MTDPADEGSRPPVPPPRAAGRDDDAQEASAAFQAHVRAAREEFESHVAHARDQFGEANERIKQRMGRDLIVAILIGLAIGVVVLASLLFVKWAFAILAVAVAALGVFEMGRALDAAGRRFDLVPQVTLAAALVAGGFLLDVWMLWVLVFVDVAIVVVWRLLAQMMSAHERTVDDIVTDALAGGFVQLYVPFLASLAMVLLREDGGEWWVLAFLIVAVASDTGAYAAGVAFGRTPMAPRISPKKTWEGFAGATLAALSAGVLLAWLMLGMPWWVGLPLGAVILLTATAGDLGESMLKRDLGIKDMSSWLPGHGGVLDRLDSILPSAPAALALFLLFSPLAVA
ncbi:phosphatidate cytidylyltransferase [Microbacterium sp. LRZ72]|uniref:phosphatidate cytidylyltransferase n=1 Tax=Microbacterium sp. LRZ72 TaxID=2942481 RepID=UPI0029BE6B36|nr:phosphatidate cytidylyltransferase [Microbacterium sp. LRZ72]MDX2375559.1 phosphatidate cytidylyltransferase [Microbacterium sp. LRZ72]